MFHRSLSKKLVGLATAALLAGCSAGPTPSPGNISKPPATPPPMSTPSATVSASPTASPSPSGTPEESATPDESATPSGSPTPHSSATPGKGAFLEPLPGVKAPKLSKVVKIKFQTSRGDLLIELYPEAAPNAAKRFEELVKAGFYDNTPIFRIVPNFVAQFGVNSDPKHKPWKEKNFDDDPSLFKLEAGTLAFAKAGPNTNSTQVFINYQDNSQMLVPKNFTAFGKITKGYDKTEKFKQVGDPSMGLDQGKLWEDHKAYLESLPEKPDMIVKAEVIK